MASTGCASESSPAQGRLWYGPQADGGWEVRAQFTLSQARAPADDEDTRPAAGRVRLGAGEAASWLRQAGPWVATAVTLAVLCADACLSGDRRGPLALSLVLAAGMALVLPWWRRFPLLFLIAVNLVALPVSNGLASINNPTVVSTYVFTVPVCAVAYWSATPAAVTGLALTAAFDTGEGLYWHLGAWSIGPNVLLTVVLWIAGRAARRQRLLAADLGRARALLEAGAARPRGTGPVGRARSHGRPAELAGRRGGKRHDRDRRVRQGPARRRCGQRGHRVDR